MTSKVLIDFVHHIALLLAIALAFDLCVSAKRWARSVAGRLLTGFFLGLTGIALMLVPLHLAEGIQFDARSVVLALSGFFFGVVPTLVAAAMTILFRVFHGGVGVTPGILVIVASGVLGLFWRWRVRRKVNNLADTPPQELLFLGIAVHVVMLALLHTLPRGTALEILPIVGPYVLVLYPLAALAVGLLLRERLRRQRAVRELTETRDRYRKLTRAVEQSPASVVITDPKGSIEYVNPKFTAVTGYAPEEVIGRNPRVLKSGNLSRRHYAELWRTIQGGKEWRGEFLNRRKDGSTFWEFASISPILGENEKITAFLAVKEDITDKKHQAERLLEAKEEAERANRAKSSFLAVVSHELRTPLNGIFGPCQLALENARDPEDREMLQTALDCSEQLLRMIDKILLFAEIDSSGSGARPEPVDLRELVASTVLDWSAAAQEKGVGLALSPRSTFPKDFISDPAILRQILLNLIENAVKFTTRGAVAVMVGAEGEGVTIAVSDTGCGIPEETRKAIFDLFSQGDMRLHREHAGIGLGLSIAKVLTERIEGRMSVESEPDKGSVFTLRLPRHLRQGHAAAGGTVNPPAPDTHADPPQTP